MNRTSELLNTLKHYLKAKGMTYRQLGVEMDLSETSVKRLFSKKTFSLKRVEDICKIIEIDLYDLVMMSRQKNQQQPHKLTVEQEAALAEDSTLCTFFYFLVNGWSLALINEEYNISEHEATGLLLRLDRMGLIELYPENRFKLLISANVFWRKNGPLWNQYLKVIKADFFNHPFDTPNSRIEFNPGQLSDASLKIILKKIDGLVKQFNELAELDTALPLKNRFSTGFIIGFRPWVFSMISDLKKNRD